MPRPNHSARSFSPTPIVQGRMRTIPVVSTSKSFDELVQTVTQPIMRKSQLLELSNTIIQMVAYYPDNSSRWYQENHLLPHSEAINADFKSITNKGFSKLLALATLADLLSTNTPDLDECALFVEDAAFYFSAAFYMLWQFKNPNLEKTLHYSLASSLTAIVSNLPDRVKEKIYNLLLSPEFNPRDIEGPQLYLYAQVFEMCMREQPGRANPEVRAYIWECYAIIGDQKLASFQWKLMERDAPEVLQILVNEEQLQNETQAMLTYINRPQRPNRNRDHSASTTQLNQTKARPAQSMRPSQSNAPASTHQTTTNQQRSKAGARKRAGPQAPSHLPELFFRQPKTGTPSPAGEKNAFRPS